MTPEKIKSILRAVIVRALLYTSLALIVLFTLVDVRSLLPESHPAPIAQDQPATGPDWPQLRGPTYDAHSAETDLADAWPASGPPVLWTKEIGPGFSSFIIHANRAYTQAQALTEQKVLALNADTGQTLWEHGYTWPYQPGGMFPGPRSTPTFANNKIYFTAPNGLLECLDASSGHSLWSVNVLQKFKGRGATFGYACSPLIEDNKVILPVGGSSASVVALDANTGATIWTAGSAPASYCSALPITFQGHRQIVAFLQNTLTAIDLKTGNQLWEQSYAKGNDEHAAAPIYSEPYLRTMQAYRAGSDLHELEADSTRIKRLRHDAQMSNDVASSVLVNGYVYGFDLHDQQTIRGHPSHGTFRCMDFKTGEIKWSSDQPGQCSIVVADNKLFMLSDTGELLLVRANPNRYEELARADLFPGETCWSAPALSNGRLYLRSPTRAACVFVAKPEKMTPRQKAQATPLAAIPKSTPTDLRWLIGADRDYPFEMPDARELSRWYLFSLAAFFAAALAAAATKPLFQSSRVPSLIFSALLILSGVLATPIANHYTPFIFTWPLTLIAVQQIALTTLSKSKPKQLNPRAIAATLLLVLAAVLYFKLTRQLNLAPAWYFLVTLPAAWPIAIPAARKLREPKLKTQILLLLAIFTLYFWTAGAVMLFRTAQSM